MPASENTAAPTSLYLGYVVAFQIWFGIRSNSPHPFSSKIMVNDICLNKDEMSFAVKFYVKCLTFRGRQFSRSHGSEQSEKKTAEKRGNAFPNDPGQSCNVSIAKKPPIFHL